MTRSLFRSLLIVFAATVAGTAARAESGKGLVGDWTVLWRAAEADQGVNVFRETLGPGVPFPFRVRLLDRIEGMRIVLLDVDGKETGEIPLGAHEQALVADDGSARLVWSADSLRSRNSVYRYYRADNPEPEWQASAPGEPILFAPDGSLFVLAAADTANDDSNRFGLVNGGRVQVVDAKGTVRGVMPILPTYVRFTGDQKRIAMLHANELVVLRRDGVLDWNVQLPIDAVVAREGHSQLEAQGGKVVVSGTGPTPQRQTGAQLGTDRRGTMRAFSDDGKALWKLDQDDADLLWFQISLALSRDGETLASFFSDARDIRVRLFDADTGQQVWERTTTRRMGTACLSISPDGQLVVLAFGDQRTYVVAWDREGSVVWEGDLPLSGRVVRIGPQGLLVARRWIVQLTPGQG